MQKRSLYPIHPGEIFADELVELNTSPTELARALHVPANRISQLVAGKRSMVADTALRIEKWLGDFRLRLRVVCLGNERGFCSFTHLF